MIRSYRLEGRVFDKLAMLLWAGFTVHYFLPARWRLQFFGLLSAAGILVIFGPLPGAWLLGIGLAVIGICHLPIPFAARLAILLSATVVLGAMRVGRIPVPWSAAIWPVLGSMFALRIIVYLYDLKHRNAPFSFWRSVAYFFMLPERRLPALPGRGLPDILPDATTTTRTEPAATRSGIDWMVRGTSAHPLPSHLPAPADRRDRGRDVPQLLRYLLVALPPVSQRLRPVSPRDRDAHLFGFNLPETHHLYLPGLELHGLLAADQHLLERLHDEDLLLPRLLRGCASSATTPRSCWARGRVPGHLAAALVAMVLDARILSAQGNRRAVLDDPRACWSRPTWWWKRTGR